MRRVWVGVACTCLCAMAFGHCARTRPSGQPTPPAAPTPALTTPAPPPSEVTTVTCDTSLWAHVYHGRYAKPQDRLNILHPCIEVTGTIVNAAPEKDGDWHVRLDVDAAFKDLLNDGNRMGQHGYLVVEPMCETPVVQRDTREEGVCSGFSQSVYDPLMVGSHVRVVGAYVNDVEHGWNEIHPVTSITVQ